MAPSPGPLAMLIMSFSVAMILDMLHDFNRVMSSFRSDMVDDDAEVCWDDDDDGDAAVAYDNDGLVPEGWGRVLGRLGNWLEERVSGTVVVCVCVRVCCLVICRSLSCRAFRITGHVGQ